MSSSTPLVWSLPSDPSAVPLARHKMQSYLGHVTESQRDRVLLATSELVTNAVLHGQGPVTLRAWLDGRLRVEVTESGGGDPEPRRLHRDDDESGRGLHIVEVVASRWGVTPTGARPGKTVWFEITDRG